MAAKTKTRGKFIDLFADDDPKHSIRNGSANRKLLAEVSVTLRKARLHQAARAALQSWLGQVVGLLEGVAETGRKLSTACESDSPFSGLMTNQLADALTGLEELRGRFVDAIPAAVNMLTDPVADVCGLAEES